MGEVFGFIVLRFAIIGAGIVLLAILVGVLVLVLKRTGMFEQTRRVVEPVVISKGGKALEYLIDRRDANRDSRQGPDA